MTVTVIDESVARYAAYLRLTSHLFRPWDEPTADPGEFAAAAWRVASSPVMSPGYVSWHPKVQQAVVVLDDDRRAAVRVELMVPPHPLTQRLAQFRGWQRLGGWWGEPESNAALVATTTLTVRVPLENACLPTPQYQPDGTPEIDVAVAAVAAVCAAMSSCLRPVLAALDAGTDC
ncbi:hypothetical protein UA75_10590 [Actinoalloteichus sp. GBA129-24]|nr:hypothetical protein UA75_10590 [Actinoalloteichus sp. GBA129-24]